eukprot:scaffold10588_cov93-Isochrysis_galbana.AAC.1
MKVGVERREKLCAVVVERRVKREAAARCEIKVGVERGTYGVWRMACGGQWSVGLFVHQRWRAAGARAPWVGDTAANCREHRVDGWRRPKPTKREWDARQNDLCVGGTAALQQDRHWEPGEPEPNSFMVTENNALFERMAQDESALGLLASHMNNATRTIHLEPDKNFQRHALTALTATVRNE